MTNPTLAEDITYAISCMQDYRDTLDIDSESWYKTGERIERLFQFYYQLTGFDPNGEHKDCGHAVQFARNTKYAGLRNGKIVEFSNDKLSLNHDHIDQIIEIELDNPTGSWNHALYWDGTKWVDSWGEKQ